jgi:hypothetical protein
MTLAASLAVLVGVAAGCGADSEPTTTAPSQDTLVRAVVAKFGIATQKQDYRQICDDLLSSALVARIEDVGLPCEGALQRGLGDVRSPTLEITDVSINGDKALVSVHTSAAGQKASNDALQLVRENGSWRISSLDEPAGSSSTTTPPSTSTSKAYPNGTD